MRDEKKRLDTDALKKLKVLLVIVNRGKADFYADLLQGFEVNLQMIFSAEGTASTEMMRMLGLSDADKAVIAAVIREDNAPKALALLDEKFRTVRNGKGIACTIPVTGTIGVLIYRFLSNSSM